MKTRTFIMIFMAVLFLIIAPVVVAQVSPDEPRPLRGPSLSSTLYQEVSFTNQAQDLQLAGMLFVPEGEGPFPAVVFIHGSGTSRRDNPWYLSVAQHLQENGIVVLLPDKRGSVKSEGDWRTSSFEDLATDTVAAVNYLRQQDEVAIDRIGLIGMSQGGHIVPLAASQSSEVSFLIDVVGAAVPMRGQLVYEENHNLRQMGFLPGISNLIAYPAAWSIREVRQKEFWDLIGDYDPLPYWQSLEVPGLVLFGEQDTNVSSAKSAALLQSLPKDNIEVIVYEGSGHGLEDPAVQDAFVFRQDALQAMTEFILSVP